VGVNTPAPRHLRAWCLSCIALTVVVIGCAGSPPSLAAPTPCPTFEPGSVPLIDPVALGALFADPEPWPLEGELVGLERQRIGDLSLPSGRVVAGDPLFLDFSGDPLVRSAPPGVYPVDILLARLPGQVRVAAAIVRFSDATASSFEQGQTINGDPPETCQGFTLAFSVDSGTGGFAAAEFVEALVRAPRASADAAYDAIVAQLDANEAGDWTSAIYEFESGTGNVVAMSSGYGDGDYPVFWLLDADGQPVALLADFKVLGDERPKEEPPSP